MPRRQAGRPAGGVDRVSCVRAPASSELRRVRSGTAGGLGTLAKKAGSEVWAWLGQCRARAAERRVLAQLTVWELRDIGISRGEADGESEKWSWRP